jgi:hypothetical protein
MSTDDDMPDWESQEDVIKDDLTSALQDLSRAEGQIVSNKLEVKKSALILILSVRNTILGVLQEDDFGALKKLKRECEYQDIDLIMRAAYLTFEFDNIELASYVIHRYQTIIWGLLEYLGDEDCFVWDVSPSANLDDLDDDIGFVSYEHSRSEVQEVLNTLQSLDRAFRFDRHSLQQRKIYAFDFIFSLEKLRTIFGDIFAKEEWEIHDIKKFQIFNTAFLWWINDVGELVMQLLEYWKSEQMSMMVARLIDMSRKIIDYCGSENVAALEGTFIGIDDMSELEPDFDN